MCTIKVVNFFTLDNISKAYEDRIRLKSGHGIDRISVVDFEKHKDEHFHVIKQKCLDSSYRFTPYLQKLILKGPNKFPRSISIPTVRDKIVLSILNSALQEAFPDSVKRELPNVKVRNLAEAVSKSQGKCNLHRIDIKSYYDNIEFKLLLKELNASNLDDEFTSLILRAMKNPTVPVGYHKTDRRKYVNHENKGVPQGLPISNILAEIYLRDIDIHLAQNCLHYDRYVDDIIALTGNEIDFGILCKEALEAKQLRLNEEKSNFCCEAECINYLGYTISGLDISVKKSTLERHIHSIAMMFVRLRKALYIDKSINNNKIGAENIKNAFIEDLNVKIAGAKFQNKRYGWLQYFSEINDKSIPYLIDNFIIGQFKRCPVFANVPKALKKASRAFYELKHNWQATKYLHDYELFDSKDKRTWLTNRGLALGTFTKDEIDRLYSYHVGRFLSQIEKDMGVEYKI
ncbi:reverse transcriptase domain-containing protein [Desulfocurvibacter africanus]|uniref:RNA-directed DNA polymerase (Reverse transcriptase) n=1 Tax=Desulfocurvibacter africanus subsp. africanus str. Walvis Bay TaxID=690850 RepID=F3YVK5_DESAF|nr:reverse transcriptase domain-containing protein [Desulfocurvibacter africanus]EGJ48741.1 RNA-directed DNA polymerase (Reverse transcriptase) [Desulfocurvibacter africanus subsp. africanus str. Walvis Bay]